MVAIVAMSFCMTLCQFCVQMTSTLLHSTAHAAVRSLRGSSCKVEQRSDWAAALSEQASLMSGNGLAFVSGLHHNNAETQGWMSSQDTA